MKPFSCILRYLGLGALTMVVHASVLAAESSASPAAVTMHGKAPAVLDLRPPKITDLYSETQLALLLSRTFDVDMEEIEVEGARPAAPVTATPAVPGGLSAIFWAVANPLQAWRILGPLPPDRARVLASNVTTDSMPYLPPAAVAPRSFSDFP